MIVAIVLAVVLIRSTVIALLAVRRGLFRRPPPQHRHPETGATAAIRALEDQPESIKLHNARARHPGVGETSKSMIDLASSDPAVPVSNGELPQGMTTPAE
jgi:hypothetical protein